MKRILITGINGKIGSVLYEGLSANHDVWGIDVVGKSEHVRQTDIADLDALTQACADIQPDAIVHLAANPSVDAQWDDLVASNIVGVRNIFEATRQTNIPRIIFASTNRVTGNYEGKPKTLHLKDAPQLIHPDDPVRPDSLYATTKIFGEVLGRFYHDEYAMTVVCLRIGSFLKDNDPTGNPRHMKTWVSHRDFVQLVERALGASVGFGIYYAVSDNTGRFWDISNAESELGYTPQDNAATL